VLKVELGTLKNKADELMAFLEPRVGTKPSLTGSTVEIDDANLRKGVRPRHVKTYVKRFLYINSLRRNYRVRVQGQELTVQELELGEKEKEEREKVKEKLEKAEKEEKEAVEEGKPKEPAEPTPTLAKEAEKAVPKAEKKKPKGGAKKKTKKKG
jgi:hypothetical protein